MSDTRFRFVPDSVPENGDALYVSFERKEPKKKKEKPKWILGLSNGKEYTKKTVTYGDYQAVSACIDEVRSELDLNDEFDIYSVHEVSRKGHSMSRDLVERGIKSIPIDPASPDGKKNKPGKTDRLDAMKLVRLLVHFIGGDHDVFNPVNPPSHQIEDDREISRERRPLVSEQNAHTNRIRALLFKHGIDRGPDAELMDQLDEIETSTGEPLGTHLKARIQNEYERLELVKQQLKRVEKRMLEAVRERKDEPIMTDVINLYRMKSFGFESAYEIVLEGFGWREFQNRGEVASFLGADDVPSLSGKGGHREGISKHGNSRLLGLLVQLAWAWTRNQPKSELAQWFYEKSNNASRVKKKKLIVGLARKLANRIRVYLETGEVPRGAVFKTNPKYSF